MSTKPNNPKNENEETKPFIDLSLYYDDDRVATTDDWKSTGVSEEEAKNDVFGQLGDNGEED